MLNFIPFLQLFYLFLTTKSVESDWKSLFASCLIFENSLKCKWNVVFIKNNVNTLWSDIVGRACVWQFVVVIKEFWIPMILSKRYYQNSCVFLIFLLLINVDHFRFSLDNFIFSQNIEKKLTYDYVIITLITLRLLKCANVILFTIFFTQFIWTFADKKSKWFGLSHAGRRASGQIALKLEAMLLPATPLRCHVFLLQW